MKTTRIIGLLIALVALAIPASASAAANPFQWAISPAPAPAYTLPNASTPYTMSNGTHGALGYGKRTLGVDLSWNGKGQWEFMRQNERDHRRLVPGESVALKNTFTNQYLVYKVRTFGINLDWSYAPSRQWIVSRAATSGALALYNTVTKAYVVYGERPFGINLVWLG